MPRVVPSQAASFIDQAFESDAVGVSHNTAGMFSALVRLVEEIPQELLTLGASDYDDLICGMEAIRSSVTFWQQKGVGSIGAPTVVNRRALNLIHSALLKCPDEIPSPSTADLAFIEDAELKDSIRLDISTATSAFHNGEWKAATVLAGSAAEALLLWAITDSSELQTLPSPPKGAPDRWGLGDYIGVAETLSLIDADTAKQATLAKNFRNLVHPGRAQRLGESCDRATALTALAALEHIVRDLIRRPAP